MKFLSDIVIGLFDLLEAEGRALRKNVVDLLIAAAFFIVAGALTIAGLLLLLAGLHAVIAAHAGRIAAHFATGSLALVLSVALFARGFRAASNGAPPKETEHEETEGNGDLRGGGQEEAPHGDGAGNPVAPD